jgi:putative transcriptional regulator
MEPLKSVVSVNKYGRITFHFNEVMQSRGINRNQLARLADFRFEVANRLYNGEIERLDMDILARVCYALNCEVGDVIRYENHQTR